MAAPGMTLEEKERIMRQVSASSTFKSSASTKSQDGAVKFALIEQTMLVERLLSCEDTADFFRQPPFSLTEHAAPKTLDAAFKRAGKLVHPDKCQHPQATEAFQRLAHFRAAEVARRDVQPLQRDKCEECGAQPERGADMLFVCKGCGTRRCHACNFGLVDLSTKGPAGDQYCFTCVWLEQDLALHQQMDDKKGSG